MIVGSLARRVSAPAPARRNALSVPQFVPIGYSNPKLMDLSEIHGESLAQGCRTLTHGVLVSPGGSPYGAGTIAGPDGSRMPSALELSVAEHQVRCEPAAHCPHRCSAQGKLVATYAARLKGVAAAPAPAPAAAAAAAAPAAVSTTATDKSEAAAKREQSRCC
jgi:hypothetical protein